MNLVLSFYSFVRTLAVKIYHSLFFPALIVLVVILTVTFWAAQTAEASLERNIQIGMDTQAATMQRSMNIKMKSHEQILSGTAALLQSSDSVDEQQWRTYVNSYNLQRDHPSAEASGVVKPNTDLGTMSVVYSDQSSGQPAPVSGTPSQEASDKLFDQVKLTRGAVVVPEDKSNAHLLLGLPLYGVGEKVADGSQSESDAAGYVYEKINSKSFFERAAVEASLTGVRLKIFVGDSKSPAYVSPDYAASNADATMTRTYVLYGQTIKVDYRFNKESLVNKTQLDGPILIASGGTLAGILIASIVYLLLMSRARELQIEKAHDVDIAKDDLLSLASHQLRTPATGVKQYLGMVLQGFAGPVTDRQRNLLEKANASNDRQLAVINEVLHLAKIDAGRIVLAKQVLNINDLVQDIVIEQGSDIKAAKHTLKLQLPVKPVMVNADGHMLRMAIENVLSNAIKYTPEQGRIQVTVSATRTSVRIVVADNGIGIKPQDIPKLFQQFSRLPNELSNRVSGSGVGLYLSKHLVELHKGNVNVSSVPGKGSTFVISLPRINVYPKRPKKV